MQSLTQSLRLLAVAPSPAAAARASVVRSFATAAAAPTPAKWTPRTRRTGVLARKHGMTALWASDGARVPVTVLELDDVQVIETRQYPATKTQPARQTVTVGCTPRKAKSTNAALLGQFRQAGVEPKMRIAEFEVSPEAVVPAGTVLSSAHFVPGQHVDVQAASIGKGFQGVMKRHGFAGLRASHGTSVSHRSHGSTGQHQDPGRVFPGKKMAGRMGGRNVTTQNLMVERVDLAHNVVYVRGAVPGAPGSFVRVTDALKKVGWRAQMREKRGLDRERGEVLEGVTGLPMPAGTAEMARTWPQEIQRVGKFK